MITRDCIYICFYLEKTGSKNRLFTLNLSHIKKRDKLTPRNKLFFQLFPDLSAVAILMSGVVYYWKDALTDSHVEYQMPLLSSKENITSVEFMHDYNIIIGSSTGEIYLLKLENHALNTYMFYTYKSSSSYFMGMFSQTQQSSGLTTVEKQSSTGAIVSMRSIGETLYILTSYCIQVWRIGTTNEVEVRVLFDEQNQVLTVLLAVIKC
jgi:hypothetical protein